MSTKFSKTKPMPAGLDYQGKHITRAAKSNVERFPAIGAHLIDDATPAYSPTRPPEAAHTATEVGATGRHRPLSLLARFALALRRWL